MSSSAPNRHPAELVPCLLAEAERVQHTCRLESAKNAIVYWLAQHNYWKAGLRRFARDKQQTDCRVPSWRRGLTEVHQQFFRFWNRKLDAENEMLKRHAQHRQALRWQQEVRRELAGQNRMRQAQFFTATLPLACWADLVAGTRNVTPQDLQALIDHYGTLSNALPPALEHPETALRPSQDLTSRQWLDGIGMVYRAATAIEEQHYGAEVAWELAKQHVVEGRALAQGVAVLSRIAEDWMAGHYEHDAVSFMRQCAQESREYALTCLVPVVACRLALAIRTQQIPRESWIQFCLPAVLHDVSQFILEHSLAVVIPDQPGSLAELCHLIVNGYNHLVQRPDTSLALSRLTVADTQVKLTTQPVPELYRRLLKWPGGVTALALCTLLHDEAVDPKERDQVAALFLRMLTGEVTVHEGKLQAADRTGSLSEVLRLTASISRAPVEIPTGEHEENGVDIYRVQRDTDYIMVLLGTAYCHFVRSRAIYWLEKEFRDFFTTAAALGESLYDTWVALLHLICGLSHAAPPIERLQDHLISRVKSQCRQRLQEEQVWQQTRLNPQSLVKDTSADATQDHVEAALYKQSSRARARCEEQEKQVRQDTPQGPGDVEEAGIREYLTIVRSHLPKDDQELLILTFERRWEAIRNGVRLTDRQIDQELAAKKGVTEAAIRQARYRAEKKIAAPLQRLRLQLQKP